jgi:hypothetical protein
MPQQGTGRTLRTHSTGDVLLPPKKVNKRYGVIITHGGESWSERLASNKWTWMMGKRLLWFECPLPNSCWNLIVIETALRGVHSSEVRGFRLWVFCPCEQANVVSWQSVIYLKNRFNFGFSLVSLSLSISLSLSLFSFWWYWDLNSWPHTC